MRKTLASSLTRAASFGGDTTRDDRLGLLGGGVALAALVVADVLLGVDVALNGTFVVVPFVAAIWAGVRATALVAVATLAAGVLSGIWNDGFGTDDDVRTALLAIGGLLAIASAWARERARHGTERLKLLDEVGAVADGSLPLAQTLERVLAVIVPSFADFCMVDAIHERRVIRSAIRAGGRSDAREIERYLAERDPSLPAWMTRPRAPFPRHPRFIPRFTDEDIRRLSHGPEDLAWMRSLGLTSSITVAMLARDRMLGALTLCTAWSGRPYGQEDVRFAQALAGRVALALDNAGLFSDLESVERRMDNVMSLLDEAVVIHDAAGALVYANPAASDLMGFSGDEDATTLSIPDLGERFHVRAEDGTELAPEDLIGQRALAGESAGPLVVRASYPDRDRERWLVTRAKPIMGPDGRALYSVTAIEDVTALKRVEFAQRILARAGELLSTSTEHDRMLRGLADLIVPEFADWCGVNVPGEAGIIDQVAVAHADEARRREVVEMRERFPARIDDEVGIAEVLRTGASQVVNMPDELIARAAVDAEHERMMRAIGLRSVILAPMVSAGRTVGVLTFGNGSRSRDFDEDDLALATELARRAGTAAENARLAEERGEVARILQEGLMPPALPHMGGWETAAVYQPAGEVNAVGGDFYDAFEIEGGWMVIVGDVVGRGATAASLTALARHTIRTAGMLTGDPCRALSLLDDALRERGETALCTAAVLTLPRTDVDPASVSLVSAGHPLPLRLRGGEVVEVGEPGPLLGAFEGSRWTPQTVELEAGDQLVVFTDGVIEARGLEDRFGEERLHRQLAGADRPLTAIRRITSALEEFIGGEADDDVAVVAVRRAGAPTRAADPQRAPSALAT